MGRPQNWSERFGIADADLKQWMNLMAPGEAPLHWCLMHDKIPEPNYLQWATEAFELPVVNDDFFTISRDHTFWERVKDLHTWREDFFPLAEWDGVLLIGCLEPPAEFQFPQTHRFVLASPHHLSSHWNQHPPVTIASTQANVSIPEEPVAISPLPQSEPPVDRPEMPEGLLLDYHFPLDLASPHPVQPDTPVLSEAPDGLAIELENLDFAPSNEDASNALLAVESPEGVSPEITVTKDIELDFSSLNSASSPSPSSPPSSLSHSSPSQEPIQVAEAPTPSATISPLINKKTPGNSDSPDAASGNPGNLDSLERCKSYDDLGLQTLFLLQKTFEHGLILLFQGGKLKPWKWSELLLSVNGDKPGPIPLEEPSIFRIVYRTCLPYHGYVVPCPINDQFWNDFHRGQPPKHVTLTPIMIDRQIGGMLMGISNSEIDYKSSLKKMEALTEEVSKSLKRLRNVKAA